ncbi:putative MFS-type transporter SLC18B1 [Hypsibius exemplaris]|uniref:MFS-type transporter SLC18B1 n=1 Tax=Hypsibius exemplaris TaxID=2072580 RepID=A0A1W0X3N2_HYPEX|nr:putative MFS-type transporter SLC18B1 [Hypsibius exemplaris]
MFSRKSSSHNLLFRKPLTRAVSVPHISTIQEEYDHDELYEPLSYQGVPSASSAPVFKTTPRSFFHRQPIIVVAGGLQWFKQMSRRRKMIIVILCLANFAATVFYSCIAPFFPSYAVDKGATETEVGLLFGCFQLVIFLVSPLWGRWMSKIGAKFLFVTGLTVTGVAAILMGFLEYCPPGRAFIITCFAIRIVDAVGVSAFMTACFTIIASEFPEAISTMFGACETFNGLGYTLGPPIGGFLFQLGGFKLPFFVPGGLVCCCGLASWLLFPSFEDSERTGDLSYGKYFSIPGVWITLMSVFAATLGLGFLDAMYGPHLEGFGISPSAVGAVFLLPSLLYFICAPFLGSFIDRRGHALEFMVFGAIVSGVCYLFMGPAPFLGLTGKLYVLIIANVLLGLGTCAQLIPPFGKNLEVIINAGFEDTFDTHGMVSGALSSATALGAFVGPSAGGFAVEYFGFSWAVTGISAVQLLVTIVTLSFFIFEQRRTRRAIAVFYEDDDEDEDEDEARSLLVTQDLHTFGSA